MRINDKKGWSPWPPYTSKIIKAGALLADTKTLLSHWDVRASIRETWIACTGKMSLEKLPDQG
jgi:hypothetical protein